MKADFHIHSSYSDGDSSPEEIVRRALALGLDAVAVVDHVNRASDWVDRFSREMERLRGAYAGRIAVLSGLEAKCLNFNGDLDISAEAAESVDFVVGAMHRIPDADGFMKSEDLASNAEVALHNWKASVSAMLGNPAVDVWAHPGRLLLLHGIDIAPEIWNELSAIATSNRRFAELTVSSPERFRIPSDILRRNGVRVIPASDCHRLMELASYSPARESEEAAIRQFLDHVDAGRA